MTQTPSDDTTLIALVDVRTGRVVPSSTGGPHPELVELAPAVAELYAADHAAWAYAAFEQALDGVETSSLDEIVIVSATHVRVLQRLPWDADRALVTVGPWVQQPGVVVSRARDELARREGEP